MDDRAGAGAGRDAHASAWSLARLGGCLRSGHRLVFWGVVVAAMASAAAVAAGRPLWFDEIFTWQIATRPTVRELVAALGPMDPSPPLHYLLVRGAHALFGTGALATRLPALLSFLITLVVLHRLVAPRAGPLFALVLVTALLLTPAPNFAAEARPYALLLACSATSLLAWRAVASGGRRRLGLAGLVAALTAALYAHFYGFLLFVPIAAGEAVRTWSRRRVDAAVWIALALAAGLALPLLPLLRECLAVRTTFWAAPTLERFGVSLRLFAPLLLVAGIAALLGFAARYRAGGEPADEPPPAAAPAHEIAAAAGLAALPLLAFLVARLVTNAYDERYVLPALLGALLLLAHASRRLRRRRTEVATILFAAVGLLAGAGAAVHATRALAAPPAMVPLPLPDDGPGIVAVADAFAFVHTVHAAPETRGRLVYLIDGLAQPGAPRSSTDLSALGLAALLPLRIEDTAAFVAAHDRFWVFDPTGRWAGRPGAAGAGGGHAVASQAGGLQLWTRPAAAPMSPAMVPVDR